jgi:putative N6-adenine-specific DNA methylase
VPSTTQFEYFAVCAPGLEQLLLAEVREFGLTARAVEGGVLGRTMWPGLWDLHLRSALAESVRVRLKSFQATSFVALEIGLAKLPWHAFLWQGQPVEVRVACHKSKLIHSDAVKQRVERVIERRLQKGQRSQGAPAARVYVRLSRDVVVPSIDSSGDRLHQRGYRLHVEEAPLRETLAAGMVRALDSLAKRTSRSVTRVWDPFCGSGVLPLEWLRHQTGQLPGAEREFGFERWPTHDAEGWHEHRRAAFALPRPASPVHAFASDIDGKALESAKANAERTHQLARMTFRHEDFRKAIDSIPEGTAVLTNPPYGKRLGSPQDARRLFEGLSRLLEKREDLRPVVVACPDLRLLGDRFEVLARTRNGGVPLAFVGLAG